MLCPKSVKIGWSRQAVEHLKLPVMTWTMERDLDRAQQEIDQQFDGLMIVAINYERYWRRPWILEYDWDMVIADESHRIKAPNTKQSMAAASLNATYRLALTGTPIEKDERDLFSQFRFIDPSLLGTEWWRFCKQWMRRVMVGEDAYTWKMRPGRREALRKLTGQKTFQVKAKDVLELPGAIDQAVYFELSLKVRKAYDAMEAGYHVELEDMDVSSHLKITNVIRLQQLTGGFLTTDDEVTVQLEQDKLAAMLDYLQDVPLGEKIVIFVKFTDEIDIIAEAMEKTKRTVSILDGRTEDQGKAWTEFQDFADPQVLIVQVRAGGVGIELFASCIGIFYSNSLSYIDYDQMRKRIDRNGQRRKVRFVHMIAENSVDEDIYLSLKDKSTNAETILKAMKQRRKRNGR